MSLRFTVLEFLIIIIVILALVSGFSLKSPVHAYPKVEPLEKSLAHQELSNIKIVAGQDANQGQFKYQILMLLVISGVRYFQCGGSLISNNYVLSAAHCVDGYQYLPSSFRLVAGEHDFNVYSGLEQDQGVSRVIMHEGYNNQTIEHDIALLQTIGTFFYNAYVGPICVPPPGWSATGTGLVSGWGQTSGTNPPSPILQYTILSIITDLACQALYGSVSVRENDICAGPGSHGQTVCYGDSGGPFALENRVAGVVSRVGTGCQLATIFTETSYYTNWIQVNSGVGYC